MALIPEFDGLRDIRFIANYYLKGCRPPFDIIVQTSAEPVQDLTLLFVGFDPEEWFQEIFDPRRGRGRGPARKGRKRPRRPGIPDWNQYFASKLRRRFGLYRGLRIAPFTFLFRVWGVVDAFNFSIAVVEGLTDIGFAHLWGVFKLDPNNCTDMGRVGRQRTTRGTVGGAGGPLTPLNLPELVFNQGFIASSPFSCRHTTQPYVAQLTSTFVGLNTNGAAGRMVLFNQRGEIKAASGKQRLQEGDWTFLEIAADFAADETCNWAWEVDFGFVEFFDSTLFAYTTADIPWLPT